MLLGVFLLGCISLQTESNNTNDSQDTPAPVPGNITHSTENITGTLNQTPPTILTIEASRALDIATNFIRNSPTYALDGSGLQLIALYTGNDCVPSFYELFGIGQQRPCIPMNSSPVFENTYVFLFNFTSSSGGYGNRTDQVVTQVITDHRIAVVVKNEEVISALIDGQWDEVNQQPLPGVE